MNKLAYLLTYVVFISFLCSLFIKRNNYQRENAETKKEEKQKDQGVAEAKAKAEAEAKAGLKQVRLLLMEGQSSLPIVLI
ncbi:hypothetical protein [Sutcliffiella halmapala]|uniref:hypothetical protein n=1 Tax=Sutcliffiella halmapala TaxID=79882 RepID=UPI000994DAF3|nr:hypothetical protein [Sutcliffiella halmapala]